MSAGNTMVHGVSEYDCKVFGIPGPEHIIARWYFESVDDRDAFMRQQIEEHPDHQFEGYSGLVPIEVARDLEPSVVPPSHSRADLAELRKRADMTQQQLADSLGIPQSTVARWESGVQSPRIESVQPLADSLGCTVGMVVAAFNGTEPKVPGVRKR